MSRKNRQNAVTLIYGTLLSEWRLVVCLTILQFGWAAGWRSFGEDYMLRELSTELEAVGNPRIHDLGRCVRLAGAMWASAPCLLTIMYCFSIFWKRKREDIPGIVWYAGVLACVSLLILGPVLKT